MSNIYDRKGIITGRTYYEPFDLPPWLFACKQTLANLKLRAETLQRPQVRQQVTTSLPICMTFYI